jgi:hypothetical protein
MRTNVPRNLDTDGQKALSPDSFSIQKIEIENSENEAVDVTSIFVKLEIKDSIYSPTSICTLAIKDFNNILEDLPMKGQERIRINLTRKNHDTSEEADEIEMIYFVNYYPLYAVGTNNSNVQIIEIEGIARHAWFNPSIRISRSYSDLTTDVISKIATTDLQIEDFESDGDAASKAKGIINTQSPLQAINNLLKVSYDTNNLPFYFYQSFSGIVYCKSLLAIIESEPVIELNDNNFYTAESLSKLDYEQQMTRIQNIASKMNLDRAAQGKKGAWKATNKYIDIATKSFSTSLYNYEDDYPGDAYIAGQPIDQDYDIYGPENFVSHHSVNSFAYGEDDLNIETMLVPSKNTQNFVHEVLDSLVHDITIYGNMKVEAGTTVELKLAKKLDPDLGDSEAQVDESLSGKYVVASTIHTFEDGKYFTQARIKRDNRGA